MPENEASEVDQTESVASANDEADTRVDNPSRGDEEPFVVEQPLLAIKEVFVYRVPPLRASSGHRAEEWGLENPVFTGVLKAVQVGDSCCIRLFKRPPEGVLGAAPDLFAQCEISLNKGRTLQSFVESVIDSSRYFVLRCEDKASGRHAFVGIGFRERSAAFDLKAVLEDFVRFLERQKQAQKTVTIDTGGNQDKEDAGPVKQMKDLSIGEGQKIHIEVSQNAGTSRARRRPRSPEDCPRAESVTAGLLAPPPLPGTVYKSNLCGETSSMTEPPVEEEPPHVEQASPPDVSHDVIHARAANDAGKRVERPGATLSTMAEVAVDGGNSEREEAEDGWGEFESA